MKTTLITLAASRGSSAKTRAGARKYLLANLPAPHAGLLATEGRAKPLRVSRWPEIERQRNRMQRGAELRASAENLPSRAQWIADQFAAGNVAAAFEQDRTAQYMSRVISERAARIRPMMLLDVYGQPASTWRDSRDQYLSIAGRIIRLSRHEETVWAKNRHYPVSSTITRTASLLPINWDDASPAAALHWSTSDNPAAWQQDQRSISYEARGKWLDRIITELLGAEIAQQQINAARVRQILMEAAHV